MSLRPTTCVYTDGSCIKLKGEKDDFAGAGIYFGPGDPRNMAVPVIGKQTNQHAELQAIDHALRATPSSHHLIIRTDSKYAIDALTKNRPVQIVKSWKKPAGLQYKYEELIDGIIKAMENRRKYGITTKFEWIKGHSGEAGNEAADALAKEGAMLQMNQRQRVKAKHNLRKEKWWNSLSDEEREMWRQRKKNRLQAEREMAEIIEEMEQTCLEPVY